eukprot:GHRR01010255.1.p1 GENE.GHRR01010255.1~~GHRR01010255.1.p1  ORF type:complete len:125 (-),score=42.30 GHRR01010255.1:2472-2846(-)
MLADPTTLDQIDGRWKLLYTSRPGTASPIQRTFVGVEAFKVYQEVQLLEQEPRVNNVVEFGSNIGYLKVIKGNAGTACITSGLTIDSNDQTGLECIAGYLKAVLHAFVRGKANRVHQEGSVGAG